MKKSCLILTLLWTIAGVASERPLLSKLFSDHMVLQRDAAIPLWGWSNQDRVITVIFDRVTYTPLIDSDGKWTCTLPPHDAGGPYSLEIVVNKESALKLHDIMIGDVWICAGQSNMAWPLRDSDGFENKSSNIPADIRHFKVPSRKSKTQVSEVNNRDRTKIVKWTKADNKSIGDFSAIGYYSAKNIYNSEAIPIGIINLTYGGSRIASWIPLDSLDILDSLFPFDYRLNGLGGLYNGMVYPIRELPVAGVIWYQGESNTLSSIDAERYEDRLRVLINSWRLLWHKTELPFYIVQLPKFKSRTDIKGRDWAILRESQKKVAESMSNVQMICTLDLGDCRDLHPTNKSDFGTRISKVILASHYNRKVKSQGPSYMSHTINGGCITLHFTNVDTGLYSIAGRAIGFELVSDEKTEMVDGKILDDIIHICSDQSIDYHTLQYAFRDDPCYGLIFDKGGLPLQPFRIKLITEAKE